VAEGRVVIPNAFLGPVDYHGFDRFNMVVRRTGSSFYPRTQNGLEPELWASQRMLFFAPDVWARTDTNAGSGSAPLHTASSRGAMRMASVGRRGARMPRLVPRRRRDHQAHNLDGRRSPMSFDLKQATTPISDTHVRTVISPDASFPKEETVHV